MFARFLSVAAVAGALAIAAACGPVETLSSDFSISLVKPDRGGASYVEVRGLSDSLLDALDRDLTPEQWSAVLRIAVDEKAPGMLGGYSVAGRALRFTPAFPFDPGREYYARFDSEAIPGIVSAGGVAVVLSEPATHTTPSTVVARVYPTGDVVPENLLRMYIEFSGPMGRPTGVPFIKLLDQSGKEIQGALLPLDYEFWSPDHTRFTAFLDPGRVKDGILPNQQMGRALVPGQTVTLVISREWRDQHGLPLKGDFTRVLRVGPARDLPLDTASWRIQAPAAGSRDAVVVTFPEPLDHGLLLRALGVQRNGAGVEGEIAVDTGETRWAFTPREAWRSGAYQLLALDTLEDVAGNQIGRAFEVDNFDTVDKSPNPKTILIPFQVRP